MKRGDAFPSSYIKCEDLKGRSHTLRIKEVTVEKMGDDSKPVAWFYQREKGLVLNQTNWDTIENLYGEDSDDWTGKSITVYPAKAEFKGKRVDAVRIREEAPETEQKPQRPEPNGQVASKKPAPAMTQAEVDDMGVEDDDDTPF